MAAERHWLGLDSRRSRRSVSSASDIPPSELARSAAHILNDITVNHAHSVRHAEEAQNATTPDTVAFNLRHLRSHQGVVSEHLGKLRDVLARLAPRSGMSWTR